MQEYRIVVANENDEEIGEFTNWTKLKFSMVLNDFGECTFSVPYNDPKLLTLTAIRRYKTKIYRNNTLVWAGEQVMRDGELNEAGNTQITITSYDFNELLAHKYSDDYVRYELIDAGQIAWDLIDTAQNRTNGDFGITEGLIEVTKNRTRDYQNDNLLKSIQQLTTVIDGFDFEITPNKVFNVYARKGIDKSSTVVFEWGTNLDSVNITEDGTSMLNSTKVIGRDEIIERTNSSLAAIYSRREDVLSEVDVSLTTTLNDKGDSNNLKYQSPLLSLDFTQTRNSVPQFGSLSLGDIVKIRIVEGIYTINNNFRIYGMTVNVDNDSSESIDYEVGII